MCVLCRFALGDARRPLHDTAALVEDIVHTQLVTMVTNTDTIVVIIILIRKMLYYNIYLTHFLSQVKVHVKSKFKTTTVSQFSRRRNDVIGLFTSCIRPVRGRLIEGRGSFLLRTSCS